jgi:hypothetical protein
MVVSRTRTLPQRGSAALRELPVWTSPRAPPQAWWIRGRHRPAPPLRISQREGAVPAAPRRPRATPTWSRDPAQCEGHPGGAPAGDVFLFGAPRRGRSASAAAREAARGRPRLSGARALVRRGVLYPDSAPRGLVGLAPARFGPFALVGGAWRRGGWVLTGALHLLGSTVGFVTVPRHRRAQRHHHARESLSRHLETEEG